MSKKMTHASPLLDLQEISGAEPPISEYLEGEIAREAYFKAEARGFAPGYELADWLEAKQEVLETG